MPLHSGIETTAIVSFGVYSKVYGSANPGNIANLFVSLGYFEDAPVSGAKTVAISMFILKKFKIL